MLIVFAAASPARSPPRAARDDGARYGAAPLPRVSRRPASEDDGKPAAAPAAKPGAYRASATHGAHLYGHPKKRGKRGKPPRAKAYKPVLYAANNRREKKAPQPVDGKDVLLRDMLAGVDRQKKEKLLEMLLDIEEDLAESPVYHDLPQKSLQQSNFLPPPAALIVGAQKPRL